MSVVRRCSGRRWSWPSTGGAECTCRGTCRMSQRRGARWLLERTKNRRYGGFCGNSCCVAPATASCTICYLLTISGCKFTLLYSAYLTTSVAMRNFCSTVAPAARSETWATWTCMARWCRICNCTSYAPPTSWACCACTICRRYTAQVCYGLPETALQPVERWNLSVSFRSRTRRSA